MSHLSCALGIAVVPAFLCLVLLYIWARVCSGLEKLVTYSLSGAASVLAVAGGYGPLPVGCIP